MISCSSSTASSTPATSLKPIFGRSGASRVALFLPKLMIWPRPPAPPRMRRITKIQNAAISSSGSSETRIEMKVEPWLGGLRGEVDFLPLRAGSAASAPTGRSDSSPAACCRRRASPSPAATPGSKTTRLIERGCVSTRAISCERSALFVVCAGECLRSPRKLKPNQRTASTRNAARRMCGEGRRIYASAVLSITPERSATSATGSNGFVTKPATPSA